MCGSTSLESTKAEAGARFLLLRCRAKGPSERTFLFTVAGIASRLFLPSCTVRFFGIVMSRLGFFCLPRMHPRETKRAVMF